VNVFSILIPTWNNLPYLKLCIDSIRKNSVFKHQIIVHINEGIDGSLDWIKTQSDIDYTYSSKNIGVCYPLNMGRSLVSTDYILYANDDMYLCPGWDAALLDEVKQIGHSDFFLSATVIEPTASSNCVIEKNYGTDIGSFQEEKLLAEFASLPPDLPKADWQGATWPPNIVHRDIWDKVGGYSIEFSPGMYSDPDFSMKLWHAGVRLFKGVSKSRAYHFGSKSTKRLVTHKGYYTFISKWGMTSRTFTQCYLRRGEVFDGPLADFKPIFKLKTNLKLKHFFKRLMSIFKS
jgi:glycosyltransferase involved in cell wall biosynthesis